MGRTSARVIATETTVSIRSPAWSGLTVSVLFLVAHSAAADTNALESLPAVSRRIDFVADIQPIFEQNCVRCHGATRHNGGFRLDQYEFFLKGGDNGPAVFPGSSTNSPLIRFVARLDPESVMPPEGQGEPLTPGQVELLRAWVDQGSWWGPDDNQRFNLTLAPAVGFTTVTGNESKFRQLTGLRDGWRGGVEEIELFEQVTPETKYTFSGHALTDDYLARLFVEKSDRGFAHFGFEQFRKYDSDTGGYYPGFTPSVFSLDRDLHLDVGRAWADFGLILPDWPRMVLGYQYQYRNGEKATLQWGAVTDGIATRNIYPAYKEIDEHTHILKFDFDLNRGGWRLEDNFRGEWTDSNTRQVNVAFVDLSTPNSPVQDNVQQGWRSFEGANTLRLERQFRPWLFTSAGYLYSQLSGDADFNLDESIPGGLVLRQYTAQRIALERQSQVANANVLLGPWQGGTLTFGVQGEWTRQNGNLAGTEFVDPAGATNSAFTEIDKVVVDESVTLRYTRLPFTTLYTEARLQQESLDQSENSLGDLPPTFLRDTDAQTSAFDVRTGFDTSPRNWLKLGAYYRWRARSSTYDGAAYDPSDPLIPISGYPALITARDLTTQEVGARFTVRPNCWWKTTFSWRWVATDYLTTTKSVTAVTTDDASPGGEMFAGNYDAQIFSVNFTLTPWRRLNLFSTLSYQNVRNTTIQDSTEAVVPYRGNTWSWLFHGRYVLTPKTDLIGGYNFSSSDFQQDNFATGLPLGMDYRLHGLQVGLVSRCTKDLTTKLQYGFYHYTEPSSGGANNYTANAVFVSLNWRLN